MHRSEAFSLETLKCQKVDAIHYQKPMCPAVRPQPAAGRVVHDSRGNAVWNWAIDTDVKTSDRRPPDARARRLDVAGR